MLPDPSAVSARRARAGAACYPRVVPLRPLPLLALAVAALLLVTGAAHPRAIDPRLDQEGIESAIDFGRSATREGRRAFHDGYQAVLNGDVRRISIVSEYRRIVLLMEEKLRLLDRNYGVRQMFEATRPWRGMLEVVVELQFHPQNTYLGVPPVEILLAPLDRPDAVPFVADATDRLPHFGRFWDPPPMDSPWWPYPAPGLPLIRGTEPLSGGWIEARFDARPLTTGRHEVLVKDGVTTLARATFDFGTLR